MRFSHERSIVQSVREYGRGVAGGLIFSLPLLYTMEVWESGQTLQPARLLLYVGVTYLLLILYNRYAGLRRDASWGEVLIDSVEEMGIGLVVSAMVLFFLGRFHEGAGWEEVIGLTVMEAMTVAIGVSVGTAQLGAPEENHPDGMSGEGIGGSGDYVGQTALALCGAVLFAANVAPTDEIFMIAQECSPGQLIRLMLLSLLIGAAILYFAAFRGASRFTSRDHSWQIGREITTAYAVALVASAGALFFFGRLDGQPFTMVVAQIVVLGFPAVMGASAGRLLVQSDPS